MPPKRTISTNIITSTKNKQPRRAAHVPPAALAVRDPYGISELGYREDCLHSNIRLPIGTRIQCSFGPDVIKCIEGILKRRDITHVFGCVAWLTNPDLLDILATKECVQIVVQKEDFLRPDQHDFATDKEMRARNLRAKYAKLHCSFRGPGQILTQYKATNKGTTDGVDVKFHQLQPVAWDYADYEERFPIEEKIESLNDSRNEIDSSDEEFDQIGREIELAEEQLKTLHKETLEGVRCAGYLNKGNIAAFPRMHHKFIIVANERNLIGVLTGSFNWSKNATVSEENVVFIESTPLAEEYFKEYIHILINSEPLNWESEWSKPTWGYDQDGECVCWS